MNLAANFREQLLAKVGDALTSEFDQLMAAIKNAWEVEHTTDDHHGHITAYDIVLRKNPNLSPPATGGLTMDGPLVSTSSGSFTGDVLGHNQDVNNFSGFVSNPVGLPGAVRLAEKLSATLLSDWSIWADGSPSPGTGGLQFSDNTVGGSTRVLRLEQDPAGPLGIGYRIIDSGTVMKIGDNDAPGNRWAGGYFNDLEGVNGLSEHFRALKAGEFTDVALVNGNFNTTGGGTWVPGAKVTIAYRIIGHSVLFLLEVEGLAVTGAPATLEYTLPAGMVITKTTRVIFQAIDAGVGVAAICRAVIGGSTLTLQSNVGGGGWTATAAGNSVRLQIEFEIN